MTTRKLSFNLAPTIAEFIEQYQQTHGLRTKSEIVSLALHLLREKETQYTDAWAEWKESGEAVVWEAVTDQGLRK